MAPTTLSQTKGKDRSAESKAPAKTDKANSPSKEKPAGKKAKNNKKKKPPPKLRIVPEFCKGCGICVTFCPTQVLGLKSGKVAVLNLDDCTRCTFCELRCPDFAIYVED